MTKATPNYDLSGYDYQFVDPPPDTLVCKICHCPSKEPHLSVCCGPAYILQILSYERQECRRYTATDACPMCRSTNFQTFPNKD